MLEKKIKILFIQDWMRHYRIPLIEELAARYDLSLIQPENSNKRIETNKFKVIYLKYIKLKSFIWINGLYSVLKKESFDKYILPFDIHWINCLLLSLILPKNKVSWFGIGKSNSYLANRLKVFLAKRNNIILYSDKDLAYFVAKKVPRNKINIAHNTVHVDSPVLPQEKQFKTYLFVGTLDQRKKLNKVLEVYALLYEQLKEKTPPLLIVGGGNCKDELLVYSKELGIENEVTFTGAITQQNQLKKYYRDAICCLSYGQAGLSVLQSIANSTPYITCSNAISGGEIENVKCGHTGYKLQDDITVWVESLLELTLSLELQKQLAMDCYHFYQKERSIANMADGFKVI